MARFQLIFSAIGGAVLVGYVSARAFNGTFLIVSSATLLVFAVVGMVVGRWFARVAEGAEADLEADEALRGLDLPEARRRALALLADPNKYFVTAGPGTSPAGVALPPTVRELFARVALVRVRYGDLRLDASEIAPSTFHKGFTVIGSGTDHTEVMVRPDGDAVFVADPDEQDAETFENYPSVYHLLVCNAATVYPENS